VGLAVVPFESCWLQAVCVGCDDSCVRSIGRVHVGSTIVGDTGAEAIVDTLICEALVDE
jgi:hypothetical protein